jgi:hypothetical protein
MSNQNHFFLELQELQICVYLDGGRHWQLIYPKLVTPTAAATLTPLFSKPASGLFTQVFVVVFTAGDITLSCATFLPHLIKAAVVINCCFSSVGFPTVYKVKIGIREFRKGCIPLANIYNRM